MWLSDSPDGCAQHIWWGLRLVMALDVGYAADPRISRCTALIPLVHRETILDLSDREVSAAAFGVRAVAQAVSDAYPATGNRGLAT